MKKRGPRIAVGAAAATAGFAGLAVVNARHTTRRGNLAARKLVPGRGKRGPKKAAAIVEPAGKWSVYGPVALSVASYLWKQRGGKRRRGRRGAAAVLASAGISVVLSELLDRVLPQPIAPPGRRDPAHRVFPSGHTLRTTAVSLTSSYILAREGLADPKVALLSIGVPLASGFGRMVEDKHWGTDVLGGLLAGGAVAGACMAAYEWGED